MGVGANRLIFVWCSFVGLTPGRACWQWSLQDPIPVCNAILMTRFGVASGSQGGRASFRVFVFGFSPTLSP
eukprot:319240-Amphidinium_carterae.1